MKPTFYDPREQVLLNVAETHPLVQVRPVEDPSAHYVIPIPSGWQAARAMGHDRQHATAPMPIGLFAPRSNHEDAPHVLVTVQRLAYEVDPRLFTEMCLRRLGWEIASSSINELGRFDIGAVGTVRGKPYARRVIGFLDGARLFRIESYCPLEEWPKYHDVVWPCGPLMQLAEITDAPVEPRTTHKVTQELLVDLPSSWHPIYQKRDAMAFSCDDKTSTIVVSTGLFPDQHLRQVRDIARATWKMELARTGTRFNDLLRYDTADPRHHVFVGFRNGSVQAGYTALTNATEQEVGRLLRAPRALEIAIESTKCNEA